jgi:hypothetical protein
MAVDLRSQVIEDAYRMSVPHQAVREMGTNETGAACNQYLPAHKVASSSWFALRDAGDGPALT